MWTEGILLQCGPHNLGRNDKKKNNTALQAVLRLELEEVIKQGRLTKGQGVASCSGEKAEPCACSGPALQSGKKGLPGQQLLRADS